MKLNTQCYIIFVFLFLCIGLLQVLAQPSGGSYGPVQQMYNLPSVSGKIFYVAVDGKVEQSGESLNEPTSLEAAVKRVQTGDAIVLRGGIYRTGNLILNQGITIQPYADEQPILKGTFVAVEWKNLGNGLWKASWSRFFPSGPDTWWSRDRFGKETPMHRFNNDMVFVDGKFLQSVGSEGEVSENTYYINYETKDVFIGTDPANRLVEITAFNIALRRTIGEVNGKASDHKGPVIKGIAFTQYAYCAIEVEGKEPEGISAEADHGKDVVGTTLENCSITFCSRVAAYLRGDRLTLRNCKVSDTSTEGIYIIGSSDVLLEKNIFSRNNIERITGYYPAAVKIFNQSYRVTCRDNLIIDLPYSNGIWYDVGNVDAVFVNNWVEGVGNLNRKLDSKRPWPSESGFFFEISKGAICAGNVFVNCDQGIFILNSSNAKIYQNTFINSTACIGRNERTPATDGMFGWHSGTGPDVDKREGHIFVNNLLFGGSNYHRPLLFVWQPQALCEQLPNPPFKQVDYNFYIHESEKAQTTLISWAPSSGKDCQQEFDSMENFRSMFPKFSANCSAYINYDGPLFRSTELGNYELLPSFKGSKLGMQLPAEIRKLLSQPKQSDKYVGAYPPVQ
jgi:parallel beta-helix repeat protein